MKLELFILITKNNFFYNINTVVDTETSNTKIADLLEEIKNLKNKNDEHEKGNTSRLFFNVCVKCICRVKTLFYY